MLSGLYDAHLKELEMMVKSDCSRQAHKRFLSSIEGIRGLAALMVAVFHGFLVFPVSGNKSIMSTSIYNVEPGQGLITKLLLVLFNGSVAVSTFFVMSGLVNGMSLDRSTGAGWRRMINYVLKRMWRIYPAFLASIVLITAWRLVIDFRPPYAGVSDWFNSWYGQPVQLGEFLNNVLMFSVSVNPVAWTLQVEVLAAIVFPLLHTVARSDSVRLKVFSIGSMIVLSYAFPQMWPLNYFSYFYLGLLLAIWGPIIFGRAWWTGPRALAVLSFSVIGLIISRHVSSLWGASGIVESLVQTVWLAIIVGILVYGPKFLFTQLLNAASLRLVGRISYSFYLFHFFVLYACGFIVVHLANADVLYEWGLAFNLLLIIASISITTLIAYVSYRWVEQPCLAIGRRLTQ